MKRTFSFIAFFCTLFFSAVMPVQAQNDSPPAEVIMAKTKVDINSANAAMLALALDGIGLAKAQEIVAFREQNGDFKTVEDLQLVRGIGPATIARNRDRIVVATTE